MAAPTLPPHVRAEVQRLADATARRMLDEHLIGKVDHTDLFDDKRAAKEQFGSRSTEDKEAS